MSLLTKKILAIDVGGGTQDILLYDPGKTLENCLQLILPSPTVLVARQLRQLAEAGRAVFLCGETMGGGAVVRAVREHVAKGLAVFATDKAALTIDDNLAYVEQLGIKLVETAPDGAVPVYLSDLQMELLTKILGAVGEELPADLAIAVQDHGYAPHESNRKLRFSLWRRFMAGGGRLESLVYSTPPLEFTRMHAICSQAPGALVMDTCTAALLGALTDPRVKEAAVKGPLVLVNLGNQHTFAACMEQGRITGLFEHHTGLLTAEKAARLLAALLAGSLTDTDVYADGGHGCIPPTAPVRPVLTVVTGPRREMLRQLTESYFAAPQGNMMLMGCYGLAEAALHYR